MSTDQHNLEKQLWENTESEKSVQPLSSLIILSLIWLFSLEWEEGNISNKTVTCSLDTEYKSELTKYILLLETTA